MSSEHKPKRALRTGGAQRHAESAYGKENGKDTGGADPETGAVPFPQQKVEGARCALNVGGTTKYCMAMLSSHEPIAHGMRALFSRLTSVIYRQFVIYHL